MRNPAHVDELIIEPGRSIPNYWTDLWRYRELFYILAWRDVAVRYKQIRLCWGSWHGFSSGRHGEF
jgi:lipopolysaccharide transport system permease protein